MIPDYDGKDEMYKHFLIFKHGTPEERKQAIEWFFEVEHMDIEKIYKQIEEEYGE